MTEVLLRRMADALDRAAEFVQHHQLKDGRYRLQDQGGSTTLSTAFGAIAHFFLTGDPDHQALAALAATRDSQASFSDPMLSPETVTSSLHPYGYLADQTNYFALRAIRVSGRAVVAPPPLIEPPFDRSVRWVESLNWEDPWLESNRVMFALEVFDQDQAATRTELLGWLAANFDPETGYWGTDRGATALRGMAGAYHFYGFLLVYGFPLPDPVTVVRSTLRLQQHDGLFSPGGGGNSCLDMDALDILCLFEPALPPDERAAVRWAVVAAAEAILAMQSSTGGFPESCSAEARRHAVSRATTDPDLLCQTWQGERLIRYSSWPHMEYDATRPDLWSTLCRAVSLVRIAQALAGPSPRPCFTRVRGAGIAQTLRVAGGGR